jgi:hypothetical protein
MDAVVARIADPDRADETAAGLRVRLGELRRLT